MLDKAQTECPCQGIRSVRTFCRPRRLSANLRSMVCHTQDTLDFRAQRTGHSRRPSAPGRPSFGRPPDQQHIHRPSKACRMLSIFCGFLPDSQFFRSDQLSLWAARSSESSQSKTTSGALLCNHRGQAVHLSCAWKEPFQNSHALHSSDCDNPAATFRTTWLCQHVR